MHWTLWCGHDKTLPYHLSNPHIHTQCHKQTHSLCTHLHLGISTCLYFFFHRSRMTHLPCPRICIHHHKGKMNWDLCSLGHKTKTLKEKLLKKKPSGEFWAIFVLLESSSVFIFSQFPQKCLSFGTSFQRSNVDLLWNIFLRKSHTFVRLTFWINLQELLKTFNAFIKPITQTVNHPISHLTSSNAAISWIVALKPTRFTAVAHSYQAWNLKSVVSTRIVFLSFWFWIVDPCLVANNIPKCSTAIYCLKQIHLNQRMC